MVAFQLLLCVLFIIALNFVKLFMCLELENNIQDYLKHYKCVTQTYLFHFSYEYCFNLIILMKLVFKKSALINLYNCAVTC